MKYLFSIVEFNENSWFPINNIKEQTCFHTFQWCLYSKSINHSPFIVKISIDSNNEDRSIIGYFVGTRIWRGIWMVVAPAEGTGTYTQGVILVDDYSNIDEIERVEIYKQLSNWLFVKNIASFFQVDDWQLRRDYAEWIPYEIFHHDVLEQMNIPYSVRPTLYLDMSGKSIEELWSMQHYKSCKYSVNKAKKLGLYVRVIHDFDEIDSFVSIHYDQLVEVCARKGMTPKPSQSKKRMQLLCKSLFPKNVIMIECIGPISNQKGETEEVVMSTGIFCPGKNESIYWTGASYQRYQKFCPNELMVWEAICMLHNMNAGGLNFGGMADYKLKFGTIYAYVPCIHFSKYPFIFNLKSFAKKTYFFVRHSLARIKGRKSFK